MNKVVLFCEYFNDQLTKGIIIIIIIIMIIGYIR